MGNNVEVGRFGNKHTPEQVLLGALNHADDLEILVISMLSKDGYIHTSWTGGLLSQRLGIMDFSQRKMMDISMEEEDD